MNNFLNGGNSRVLGALLVAWLFAAVGAVMPAVMWDFDINQVGFTFFVLFALIFIVLMIGWGDPLPPPGKGKAPTVADHTAPGATAISKSAPSAPAQASSSGTASAAAPSAPAQASSSGTASVAASEPASEGGTRPEALAAARDGKPDDLKQIKGVGPALEKLCNSLGFYHFDQIAGWTADEVAWVDQNLEGFKGRVSRDDWVAQAKVLAAGGSTEFSEKVEKGDVY